MNLPFAENIKRLRKEKGWSQSDLAKQISAHLTHINRIETGKYAPSLETVAKLAKAFEVPIDYLVNNTGGNTDDIKIEDQAFGEKIKLLNSLDEDEKYVVTKVIDAMLTKKKMAQLIKEV